MEKLKNLWNGLVGKLKGWWQKFADKHPKASQWLREGGLFLIISNAITIVRGVATSVLTDVLKGANVSTEPFFWPTEAFYIIGDLKDGLAGTIGLWVPSLIFEAINFFMQRKYTFRSNGNLWFQCPIYFVAWMIVMFILTPILGLLKTWLVGLIPGVIITVAASFLQGTISVVVMFFVNKIIFTDKKPESV